MASFGAEDVRVVERHDADAGHARDLAALFPAVHVAEFGDADREFAVGMQFRFEDHDVVRAVHRAEAVFLAVALHHRVHALLVMVPVTGALVQLAFADVRRNDMLVAALDLEVLDPARARAGSSRRSAAR
jgi:hypothetical protein